MRKCRILYIAHRPIVNNHYLCGRNQSKDSGLRGTLFNYYGGTLFVSIFLNGVKNSREDAKKMLKSASFCSIVSIGKLP